MGSISPFPKSPKVPKVVYMPQAQAAPAVDKKSEQEAEARAQQEREESLLRRSRGQAGTILTSYRGLLESAGSSNQNRKTLLGE